MKLNQLIIVEDDNSKDDPGIFVAAKFTSDSCDKLVSMMKSMELDSPTEREELHATIMYTVKPVPDFMEDHPEPIIFKEPKPLATITKLHIFPTQDDNYALVALLDSEFLHDRHGEILSEYDAKYTHDTYRPHVTLTYSDTEFDLNKWDIRDYDLDLELDSEYNQVNKM